ncbi:hypothetical protein JB92DRAFT_2836558 [Gautieria morchelliformis]|nr:hypothetical protein JB92DRAFT_2836558 [Gautieria morchelliformis]
MLSTFLVVLTILFSSASAVPRGTDTTLARRQSAIPNFNIPNVSQCESACSALSSVASCLQANTANPTTCTCSSSFGSSLSSCYSCLVSAGGLDSASAQQILQSLDSACSEAGTPFTSPPTLSAGGASASGSSTPSQTISSGGTGSPSGTTSAASSPSGTGSPNGNSLGTPKNGAIITRMSYASIAAALSGVIGLLLAA